MFYFGSIGASSLLLKRPLCHMRPATQVNDIFRDLAIITKDQGMMLGESAPVRWRTHV
jgi:hypothetical protein